MNSTFLIKSFTLLLICIANFCIAEPSKEHEQWWTRNEDKFDVFNGWLGTGDAASRVVSREHIKTLGYTKVLDVPCGTCTEYFAYKANHIAIEYTGLDITRYLVARAQAMGINAVEGSIENIPFNDSSFELVYARHILEHLDYYHLALNECIRVAEKEVLVVFFIPPGEGEGDKISYANVDGAGLYHNRYNKEALVNFVNQNLKVDHLEWENIGELGTEVILHIYLK
jgi:ubiquinone/menaquinone biosynthesis C-methylase UbiE